MPLDGVFKPCIQAIKSNSGPKALKKEFSTEYMRQKCDILPYSVDQWIGNLILPYFDPKMSSLGLPEAKIIPNVRTLGIYCHNCFFVVVVAVV